MAEAEAAAAETAKAAAEAEKATAVAEKAAADTAREVAVAEAAAAQAATETAEAETAAADAARELAVAAREAAVADAAAAETARLAAEAEKAEADAARELADAAREAAVAEAALAQAATETAKAEAAEARTAQQAAEKARAAAEVARIAAEENADGQVALAVTANMAAQVADAAVVQANADLIVAQDKQKQAEDDRDAAIADRNEAQSQLRLAEAARALAEQQGRDAEEEQDRLEEDIEDARQELIQVQAQDVFNGLGAAEEVLADDPTEVRASYNENASVTTNPDITFSSTTGRAARPWFVTSFSNRTATNVDRLDLYTDVERLPDVPFKDSDYNSGTDDNRVEDSAGMEVSGGMVVDGEGDVVNRLGVSQLGVSRTQTDTASSSFPTTTVRPKSFNVVHRGMSEDDFTGVVEDSFDLNGDTVTDSADLGEEGLQAALENAGITRQQLVNYINDRGFRDEDRHPYRYSVEFRGTLGGASGTYRCGGAAATAICTVDFRGGKSYNFGGTGSAWSFGPSSATVGVDVLDEAYMYFGWWSRQSVENGSWSFRAFHGGKDSERSTIEAEVNGTATYSGPAVGYYAIYQPLGTQSGHGEFSATATLTADFDSATNTLEGRIDRFSGHPDWFLILKRQEIATNGVVEASTTDDPEDVTWSIGGIPHDGGTWEATFFSNLDSGKRPNTVPSGVAGNFEAEYSTVGRLIGAFGAHCRTGC